MPDKALAGYRTLINPEGKDMTRTTSGGSGDIPAQNTGAFVYWNVGIQRIHIEGVYMIVE